MREGIVNDTGIVALHESGRIIAPAFDADQVQPASLDLRVGAKAWRVRASFLPGGATVAEKLERFGLHTFSLKTGAVLETGCVYIVPLLESLDLADDMSASANPKSSTGRLDIFTRVITDRAERFDQVPAGYSGPLYLEISPRTFPIVVRQGSRLSQIRFRIGSALLDNENWRRCTSGKRWWLRATPDIENGGIALSIDLSGFPAGQRGRSRRLSRQAPYRRRGRGQEGRLFGAGLLGTDHVAPLGPQFRDAATTSFSIRTNSTFSCPTKPFMCRRTMPPKWCRSTRWWGVSRPLCGLLRPRLRPHGSGRRRRTGGAGSALPRSAIHSGTRADRGSIALRAHAGTARKALRSRSELQLSGAGPETVETFHLAAIGRKPHERTHI